MEIPTLTLPREDGTETVMLLPGLRNWRLRHRAVGEPLIWHDAPWIVGSKRYSISFTRYGPVKIDTK